MSQGILIWVPDKTGTKIAVQEDYWEEISGNDIREKVCGTRQ